jgi:hypothetical protein
MNNWLGTVLLVGSLWLTSQTQAATAETKGDALFDGKTLSCLDTECTADWKVEKGAIVNAKSDYGNGQSRDDFSDGILRFRFEITSAQEINFAVRQGPGAQYLVTFGKSECAALVGKAHELVFVCDGNSVTATLDGKAATVKTTGQARSGRFKFQVDHGVLRVLGISFQKLAAK